MNKNIQKSCDLLCHCVSVYHVSVDLFSRLDEMRKSIRQRDLFIDQSWIYLMSLISMVHLSSRTKKKDERFPFD